ncbi:DUF5658 family protein [Halorussus litoreus]|uniref:DUF5658 family protein n=1 Tax=Halorussus litoreus TaxID=1710536 RepID=UPI001E54CB8A|nr:DUF5658 family protein [Halorussus litoreus]
MSERDAKGTASFGTTPAEIGTDGDATAGENPGSAGIAGRDAELPAELRESSEVVDSSDPAARWMLRDDEFLLEEDREYVVRDRRSWTDYVSPLLFGAVIAVMVGDVITTGVGLAMGLEEANPVAAAVMREAGLGGLVVLKAMAAVVLLVLPGVTGNARQTFRAGSAAYLLIGVVVVLSNSWAILAVAG